MVALLLFLIYLAALTYLLFFAEWIGRDEIYTEYHYNLLPFDTIRRYLFHRDRVGWWICALNVEGNIAAFLPFGFFLPALFSRCNRAWITVLCTASFSFLVELIQLFTRVGSCDIDDLILNTLGGLLGYLLYRHYQWRLAKKAAAEEE